MSAPLMLLCTNHHLTNTRPSISHPSAFCSCFTANEHEEKNREGVGGGRKRHNEKRREKTEKGGVVERKGGKEMLRVSEWKRPLI